MGKVAAIIPAAGRGTRMGLNESGLSKQFFDLDGEPIVVRTLRTFDQCITIDEIVLVTSADSYQWCQKNIVEKRICAKLTALVEGGRERQDSVRLGLEALTDDVDIVVVHDAVRPFVTPELISASVEAAAKFGAVTATIPVKDTIKRVKGDLVVETLVRDDLKAVQTPQAFQRHVLEEAHRKGVKRTTATDDAALVEALGRSVSVIEGDEGNFKITTTQDWQIAEETLGGLHSMPTSPEARFRTGMGYDVHKLVDGRALILGGVDIPFEKGLLGHSDADVLTHAVMDALLGAAGEGDIGHRFPDTAAEFKDAESLDLLREVGHIIGSKGYLVGNIDSVVIAQRPRLASFIRQMENNIAAALDTDPDRINVKATTAEGLGFVGQGQGMAAQAVATLWFS